MAGRVSSLHVYPVKSCRGIDVPAWPLEARGLRHDRRFMVVRPDGAFVTQRELPRLACVATALDGPDADAVELSAEGHGAVRAPLSSSGGGEQLEVGVWRDRVRAELVDAAIDRWLTALLDEPLRLVRFPAQARRAVDPRWAPGFETAFADGYPVLVIAQASLDALNARVAAPVPMARFRPNLVADGVDAFAEDAWRDVGVGTGAIRVVKPCARCIVVATDQRSGERAVALEPLRTLATFRRHGHEVMFGQNAVVTRAGWIGVGDALVPAAG